MIHPLGGWHATPLAKSFRMTGQCCLNPCFFWSPHPARSRSSRGVVPFSCAANRRPVSTSCAPICHPWLPAVARRTRSKIVRGGHASSGGESPARLCPGSVARPSPQDQGGVQQQQSRRENAGGQCHGSVLRRIGQDLAIGRRLFEPARLYFDSPAGAVKFAGHKKRRTRRLQHIRK